MVGGDSGPSIVPGKPDQSILIEAVRYLNADMQMPPKKRLSDAQIADLVVDRHPNEPSPAQRLQQVLVIARRVASDRSQDRPWTVS